MESLGEARNCSLTTLPEKTVEPGGTPAGGDQGTVDTGHTGGEDEGRETSTWADFLYLAVVVDAWNRRVVGWAMATHRMGRVDEG